MKHTEFTEQDYFLLFSNYMKKNNLKPITYKASQLFSKSYKYIMIKKEIEYSDEKIEEEFYKDLELVKTSTNFLDFKEFFKKYKISDDFSFYQEMFYQWKNKKEKEKFFLISLKFYLRLA